MEVLAFPYHCGTKVVCDFWSISSFSRLSKNVNTFIGIFVDDPDQKRSYKKMKKSYKILYQSPVLSRNGHGNDYFIVIWLNQSPKI